MTAVRCRWVHEVHGTTSVEFALVSVIFFVAVLAVVDFGRALWDWNRAAKATQVGARVAVVNDLAARALGVLDGTATSAIGAPVPAGAVSPNPTICTDDGCGGALDTVSAAGLDRAAFDRIVDSMRPFFDRIGTDNVVVEYRHVGLGMAGTPGGPDVTPMVTVRLRDMRFEFLAIAFLRLPAIDMPDFRATLTMEDGHGG